MAVGIFMKVGDALVVLEQTAYDSEAVLQGALASYPEVIAGATTSGESEPRLLLLTREMPVPSSDASGRAFSLDHLFVDSECVPVFVEVKRASDTRIRREVVGQMLDYAANGVKYWPIESLQAALTKRATQEGRTAAELIADLVPELEVEEFWRRLEGNLKSGVVRLLFVADALPTELIRIIEFLNEQMSPAEVLGVELQQYVHGDHVAYVPHVVGQTAAAANTKSATSGTSWDRQTFMEAAATRVSEDELAFIRRLLSDVDERGVRLNWGKGVTPGVAGWYRVNGRDTGVWSLNANTESANSRAYLQFYLADHLTRTTPDVVERVARQLERVPSLQAKIADARSSNWKKYPSVYLVDVAGRTDQEQAVLHAVSELIDPHATSSSQ